MSYTTHLNHNLLSAAEERVLIAQAQNGDDTARDALVEFNMRLIWSVASAYAKSSETVDTEDLIGDGVIGLLHAVDKFDLRKPFRFSTYCTWWVRQSIGRSTFFSTHIQLPAHILTDIRKVTKAKAELFRTLGEEPTTDELASQTDILADRIRELEHLRDATANVQSLYAPLGSEEDAPRLMDRLEDPLADEALHELQVADELEWFLGHLNETERRVVEHRAGVVPPRYGERMPWQDIYAELYPDDRRRGHRLHWNDMPAFYKATMAKLKRLGRAVKAGEPLTNRAESLAVMSAPGQTLTLGF